MKGNKSQVIPVDGKCRPKGLADADGIDRTLPAGFQASDLFQIKPGGVPELIDV